MRVTSFTKYGFVFCRFWVIIIPKDMEDNDSITRNDQRHSKCHAQVLPEDAKQFKKETKKCGE